MNEASGNMFTLLRELTGHLQITTPEEEKAVSALQEDLLHVAVQQNPGTMVGRGSFAARTDLFLPRNIDQSRIERLERLTARPISPGAARVQRRVFLRETALRSAVVESSIPVWAVGAELDRSVGPFLKKDGGLVWFDFYIVEKLIALFLPGQALPEILFRASQPLLSVRPRRTFEALPTSVWIRSRVLAPDAPADRYTGLKIRGGRITLTEAPEEIGGRLTLGANTSAQVELDLDQANSAPPAAADLAFGQDAETSVVDVPNLLALQFSSVGSKVTSVTGPMGCRAYSSGLRFSWVSTGAPAAYDPVLQRVLVPLQSTPQKFTVEEVRSPFITLSGAAQIKSSAWALPAAQLDVAAPPAAAGAGGYLLRCGPGLAANWRGLQKNEVRFREPALLLDPGALGFSDLKAEGNAADQNFELWRDEANPFGASLKVHYAPSFAFLYGANNQGVESLIAEVNAEARVDRPVSAVGLPFPVRTKKSLLSIALTKTVRVVGLADTNVLADQMDTAVAGTKVLEQQGLSLRNAFFKVTPVNSVAILAQLEDASWTRLHKGVAFLQFGVFAYIPTLPDPYAAHLGNLKRQLRPGRAEAAGRGSVWMWLVSRTQWKPRDPQNDTVTVSFHFSPLENDGTQFALSVPRTPGPAEIFAPVPGENSSRSDPAVGGKRGRFSMEAIWDNFLHALGADAFRLLDVSSNADQFGVSFASFAERDVRVGTQFLVQPGEPENSEFPLQAKGVDVVAQARFVRALTPPVVSWEPLFNVTPPEAGKPLDPPVGFNYYPSDGGPTRLLNNSKELVPIAPIDVTKFLVQNYAGNSANLTAALFTLPFGLRALAYLYKTLPWQTKKPSLEFNEPTFADGLKGALQLHLQAGSGQGGEDDLFRGLTLQLDNVLDFAGTPAVASTLGEDATAIFNGEFFQPTAPINEQRGVPLKRIDLAGYGASTFSDWANKDAIYAATSQARFDVLVGRTSHEVIQVKTKLYPFGAQLVRTITMFRVGSGYVYRVDSGWKPESDGVYDFRFKVKESNGTETVVSPYSIHPGVVVGVFNIRNIRAANTEVAPFFGSMDVTSWFRPDGNFVVRGKVGDAALPVRMEPVFFDADVEIENVVEGQVGTRVPTKKILGFVQIAPRSVPLSPATFKSLLDRQLGAIGGSVDCTVDIGLSGQKMRITQVDVNSSTDATGAQPVFVGAARGSAVLPKDGSWSVVMHAAATGDVTPLPESVSVPLVRIGEISKPATLHEPLTYPKTQLLRIANPSDLLRENSPTRVNLGFLQSMSTQKVLFLTPAFASQGSSAVEGKLLSKTPPLFTDMYTLVSAKGIFPNIGDAVNTFGDAHPLKTGFANSGLSDGSKPAKEIALVKKRLQAQQSVEEGYKLAHPDSLFDLPTQERYLIKEDFLKIYVEYRANTANRNGTSQSRAGKLQYDVDSFANDVGERWKSKLENLAMVLDLGPLKRLMTIKGVFDSKKGVEASYAGRSGDPDFAAPQIEFSKELQPVIDILQILQDLQGEKYGDALRRGLKIAMSNSANSWEYKFEAAKEIPVVRFPTPDFLYNDPNAPFKLEASLKLGLYFNSAIGTGSLSDPTKLIPSAGAFLEFQGRLSVMCVSLSIATVYAVGQVDLRISGDTKTGPSLRMKFGFGAQVVIGLPVVGNVSVMYVVGVEIYTDSTTLIVSAFLLFQGHAEILGGLIAVTISIEAKGGIKRIGDRTDCVAQVTFGLDTTLCWVIDIEFTESWEEHRQIA